MYDESAVYLVREALILAMLLAGPALGLSLVIGLVISLVQSITSIQDQTITFVPKLLAMVGAIAVLMPWTALRLVEFAQRAFELF